MRVIVRSEGGFAGLRVGGEVDTAELSPEMAEQVKTLLRPVALETMAADPSAPSMPDAQRYEVHIEGEDHRMHRFLLDQTTAPEDVMQLLHDLHAEIMRRRIAERRGQ
jgi:hypothetical protein